MNIKKKKETKVLLKQASTLALSDQYVLLERSYLSEVGEFSKLCDPSHH